MNEIMKINKLIYLVLLIVISVSCTDDFEDYNKDPKRPETLEGEYIFNNGQKELVDYLSNTNVNRNIFKLIAQYWTETTYTDEANYDLTNRNIPEEAFETYYRDVLKSFKEARELIAEDPLLATETEVQKQNKIQIIRIMEVYVYHNLINIFGNVPYTEALDIENINPVYDDAETIYDSLFIELDDAKSNLDLTAQSFVGTNDHIYGGDVGQWMTFANSLKLKMAMSLADYNTTKAQTMAEEAVTDGVITSAADNAMLAYEGSYPNTNPLYEDLILSGRHDFVVANTIVDIMDSLNDPRMDYYFSNKIDGEYVGGIYGASNSYPNYSHINPTIESATFPGIIMTYDEIQFYIAEAAARGWSVGQTADVAYNAAIMASFAWWGAPDVATYLAQPEVVYDQNNWVDLIGHQSYIAFYTRGLVAWDQYRRLDVPTMNVSEDALTGGPVPTRFTYPVPEQTLNADNYYQAAEDIGGDDMLTRLFWDVADPQ
jgi:hypothetical protein